MRLLLNKIIFGTILLCIPVFLFGQSQGNNQASPAIPTGPDGSALPSFQDRVQQLRDAGVSPGNLPGNIQLPPVQAPSQSATPSSSGFPMPSNADPTQTPLDVEGTDKVLDEEDTEFDQKPTDITEDNLSREISNIFGHQVFREENADFKLYNSYNPPDDYIIAPGDIFSVTVFGPAELVESLPVGTDGSVKRPYLGKIYVAGLTYGVARERIIRAYGTIVSSRASIEVRLTSDRRSINVNIVGEVVMPGSYKIDAATPAFNALFAAGGINAIGSVRNILIKRDGKIVQILDLYDYLIFGQDEPIYLKDNDFIFVPIQEKIVKVSGPVKRPMEYELLPNENLKKILDFSGGLSFDAKTDEAQIARLDNQREVLIDFNLDSILVSPRKDYLLRDGDHLILKSINKGAFNIVQIFGNVEYEGSYQLTPGDKISDLIEKAGGLGIEAYRERAYVVRIIPKSSELIYIPIALGDIFPIDSIYPDTSNIANIELQYFDAVLIFSQSDFIDRRFIEVAGWVRNPGVFRTSPTMSLKDLLYLAGGPKVDADINNIELSKITKAEDLAVRRILTEDEREGRPGVNIEVETGDQGGENSDGGQDLAGMGGDGESVDILSDNSAEIIRRIDINTDWEQDLQIDTLLVYNYDRLKVYSKYDFIFFKYIDIEGAVNEPGKYQLKRGMSLKDAFYMAGGLREDASKSEIELYRDIDISERGNFNTKTTQKEIIRVRIRENWQQSNLADSIKIGDFRKIIVRSEMDFFQQGYVEIKGLVNKPGIYEVLPQMTLKDLVYMAEGLKMEADFENIELSRVFESISETGEIIPVPVTINTVTSTQNWQEDTALEKIKINAFDQVIVRKNPNFQLQESVYLQGEVLVEGEYNKKSKDESLSSLVARAGGITELAYLEGAFIRRPEIGNIAIKLDKALKKRNSRFDIPLLEGDTLVVPERLDIVTINGNVLKPKTRVLYEPNRKKLKYYVGLAGGFDKRTKRKQITVTYVDGRVKSPKRTIFFRNYPKIEQGAVITVARRPDREKGNYLQNFSLQEVLAGATSILTFYLLIDRTIQ